MSLKVFYCYAHEDKMLRSSLEKHLATLNRQALITEWHDRDINAGKEWEKEIDINMTTADIILLLISPDFVHSDYCYGVEMKHALERHEKGTARVIPIILHHGDYKGAPFNKLQSLPTDAIPVTDRKWRNRNEAFFNVARGIRTVVEELISSQWLSEGNILFFRGQYQEALEVFKRAIYFDSNNALAYIGQGQALNQIAHDALMSETIFEKALNAFLHAINLDPTSADAYTGKGRALLGKSIASSLFESPHFNDKEEILEAFNQASHFDLENEEASLGLGDTFMHFQDYEEAVEAYKKSLRCGVTHNRDTYEKLGKVLQKLERYEEAIEFYDFCIKQNVQNADLYFNIGKSFQALKRYEEALKYYDKALAISNYDVTSGNIYIQKGKIFYELKNTEESLEEFNKAIQTFPNYAKSGIAEAHRGKGTAFQLLANREFQKADEIEPPKDLPPLEDSQDELPDWESIDNDHPF